MAQLFNTQYISYLYIISSLGSVKSSSIVSCSYPVNFQRMKSLLMAKENIS